MAHRGGREAYKRRIGIGEDERQSVMARLAAWKRSNLVMLVALRKGNCPDEAYARSGRRKLYTEERTP